jgi:FkbM family methyltransferase
MWPRAYVRAMARRVERREPEMALLPYLCDRLEVSLDVGALWGAFAWRMAPVSLHCHAFEANPEQMHFLQRCFKDKVTIHHLALSDRRGRLSIRVPTGVGGRATVETANRLEGLAFREYGVQCAPLDDLGIANVGFVKIDVEGHEPSVLQGMRSTLESSRPTLLVEIEGRHNADSFRAVTDALRTTGYGCFVYIGGSVRRVCDVVVRPAGVASNYLFVHEARQAAVRTRLAAGGATTARSGMGGAS